MAVPRRSRRVAFAVAIALTIAVLLALCMMPIGTAGLAPDPHPARDYPEAMARLASLEQRDGADIQPACRTLYLGHGRRTARAVLLLHGLTNCPRQYEALGRALWEAGENVLIVRLPHHGLADRMTEDLGRLTARELIGCADSALDVAAGLGDSVTVSGLSLGGVIAAWLAQTRDEVDRAVIVAPLLGLAGVPRPFTPAIANLWLLTPNRFHWWDPRQGAHLAGPAQVYPRFSTRAIGETLRLGFALRARAAHGAPRARRLVMVGIATDRAVNNALADDLAAAWRAHGADVVSHLFPARLGLGHDIIDPAQVGARPALVYPVLMQFLK